MSREDYNWLESNLHAEGLPNIDGHLNQFRSSAPDQPPPDRVASPYYAQPFSPQTQYGASSQGQFFQDQGSAQQPAYRYQKHYYHSPYYHSIYGTPPPQLAAPSAPPQSHARAQPPAPKPPTQSPAPSSNHPTSNHNWNFPSPTSNSVSVQSAPEPAAGKQPQNNLTSDRNLNFPSTSPKTSTIPPAPQAAVTNRPQNNTSNRNWHLPSPSAKASTVPPAPKAAGTDQPQKTPWSVYFPSSSTASMSPAPKPATTKEPHENFADARKWRTYSPNTSTMKPTSQGMTVQPPPAKKQRVQAPSSSSNFPIVRPPSVRPSSTQSPKVHAQTIRHPDHTYSPSAHPPSEQLSSVHPTNVPSPSVRLPVPPGAYPSGVQPPNVQLPHVQQPGVRPPSAYPPRGYFNTQPASAFPPASSTPKDKLSGFYPSEDKYLKHSTDIAKPMDEASAAIKTTYNPETIARDVLIASGRHPTEKPLNYHLFRLRDVFTQVDFNTDLASFRWDLVDPGEPVPAHRVAKSRETPKAPRPAAPINTPVKPTPAPPPASLPPQIVPPSPSKKLPKHTPPQNIPSQSTPKPSPRPQPVVAVQPPPTPTSMSTPKMVSGGTGRRPGRPPKSKVPVVQVPVGPPPEYPVYKCEWANCQAELHNLETLKKHAYKVHVPFSLTCQWKGCTTTQSMPAVELLKHMKKDHIELVAWKQGDGPSVLGSVNDDDANMSILTIPDLNQPINEDPLIFPASYSSIRAFNQVHGNRSQRDKALQILKAVQRLKEQVGFGLDPGGCQLATPARSERFSNEEDVYEVKSD